jgi:hypothetical protein
MPSVITEMEKVVFPDRFSVRKSPDGNELVRRYQRRSKNFDIGTVVLFSPFKLGDIISRLIGTSGNY